MADGPRIGVQLPEVERDVRWPEYVAMARAAEDEGFDSIWVGDHYLYRDDGRSERGPWEAWTLLAGLAAVTERVRLGPLVACLNFHPPAVLAKTAATVDELSGGRLVFGAGAGWNRAEFDAFGLPYDHRASRFEEAFEVIRRLLDRERVTFEGRWHRVRDAVLLPRPRRRPTLMVGSTGERVLAATLPHVDAWNTWYDWYGNTPDGFAAKVRAIDEACERVGREPSTLARSACVLVRLGDDGERHEEEGVTPLTRERVGDGLRAIAEAGADELILVLDPITEESIRSLGEVVRATRRGLFLSRRSLILASVRSPAPTDRVPTGHERRGAVTTTEERMTPEHEVKAARCEKHVCCILVPRLEASDGFAHLSGEWHLEWMENDSAWFLVPPQGNVIEVRVPKGGDAPGELAVDGVPFDGVRAVIERDGLFPPC